MHAQNVMCAILLSAYMGQYHCQYYTLDFTRYPTSHLSRKTLSAGYVILNVNSLCILHVGVKIS